MFLCTFCNCTCTHTKLIHRVLDIEPESEDEDAIIERRRQLRQAIVQKYQQSLPPTEVSSRATSLARSDADSDTVGDEATKDLEKSIQLAKLKIQQKVEEGESSVGPAKMDAGADSSEMKQKTSNLLAVRAAVRNGDMFSEELFGEKYLVRVYMYMYVL